MKKPVSNARLEPVVRDFGALFVQLAEGIEREMIPKLRVADGVLTPAQRLAIVAALKRLQLATCAALEAAR